jgi:glycyl-tRNA synthetase
VRACACVESIALLLAQASISHKVDDAGQSIGRRYARTDEIGIPFGITVDFQTLQDKTVTMRERDSTLQVRIPIDQLAATLQQLCQGSLDWAAVRSTFPHVEAVAE